MSSDSVSMLNRHTTPWRPLSSPCLPPGRVKARKLVTYRRLLLRSTARPRGWKWRLRSGPAQRPRARSTLPTIRGRSASITVIVSWPLLATKTRRPSGEATMFQGSAPVVRRRTTCARKALVAVGLTSRMTLTELPAAFATNANRLDGSSATLCGSSPTRIVRRTVFDDVRTTVTLSAPGLTTHTNRPSRDIEIGLEVVAPENVRRACAALATGPAAAGVAAGRAAGREPPVAARAETAKPPRITATAATSRRALRWYALMQTSFGHSAPTSPPPRTTLPGAAPGSQVSARDVPPPGRRRGRSPEPSLRQPGCRGGGRARAARGDSRAPPRRRRAARRPPAGRPGSPPAPRGRRRAR